MLTLATLGSIAGGSGHSPPREETPRRADPVDAALRTGVGRPFADRPDAVLPPPQRRVMTVRASRGSRSVPPPRFVRPIDGYTLSSGFGRRWGRLHAGLDFAAPPGTPVRAVAEGQVVEAGWSGDYGRLVLVRHRDGVITAYAHLSVALVPVAARVRAGEVVGRVGSTGRSTGPHLHFEVRQGETPMNPLPWLRRRGLRL